MENVDTTGEAIVCTKQDDDSIETLSENGDLGWSFYSPGSYGSLMEVKKLNAPSKMATLLHPDGRQFIDQWASGDGLSYSAEIHLGGELWRLAGDTRLLTVGSAFVAKVSMMESAVELDNADDFDKTVGILLGHLKVEKVLLDDLLGEYMNAKVIVKMILDKLAAESTNSIDRLRDLMLLRSLLGEHGNELNPNFKSSLEKCSNISKELITALGNYMTKAVKLMERNEILDRSNRSPLSGEFLKAELDKVINAHRTQLAANCPTVIKNKLMALDDDHILHVTMDDVSLFTDLNSLDRTIFEPAMSSMFSKMLARNKPIHDELSANASTLPNRIFYLVCKSLQKLVEELAVYAKLNDVIVYNDEHGWQVSDLQEESQTSLARCLREQLQMVAKLANHFEPGGSNRTKQFPYEFKVFQDMESIPEEVRIWLCLLDHSMADGIQDTSGKMQTFSCLFNSYVSFVSSDDFQHETLESMRMITHNALRSLAEMKSCIYERINENLDVNQYKEMLENFSNKLSGQQFKPDFILMQGSLLRIILRVSKMNVPSVEAMAFSKLFKYLLDDISSLELKWFVRLDPSDEDSLLLQKQFSVLIGNQQNDTDQKCFQVQDVDAFVKMYRELYGDREIPIHYQLRTILNLLLSVETLAKKQSWKEGKQLLEREHLESLIAMITAIRRSLLYLKQQLDYVCFDNFVQTITDPFFDAVENSTSLEDFTNRMAMTSDFVNRSIPNLDTIDIKGVLQIIQKCDSASEKILIESINLYSSKYDQLINEYRDLPSNDRIKNIVGVVRSKLEPLLATSWTCHYKQNTLPEILAGLSAAWSVQESKNDSLIKPTCLEICCILYFLSVDAPEPGVRNHLLQISARQGKALVLGFIAALLALHDHRVQIVSYHNNLTKRNAASMIELFRSFSIRSNIAYGTIEDMAVTQSKEIYEKYVSHVNECLGIHSASFRPTKQTQRFSELEKSVLLIDEIDIFRMDNYWKQSLYRFVSPNIPGLGQIQEKIHNSHQLSTDVTKCEIVKLLCISDHPDICKLKDFLSQSKPYNITDFGSFRKTEHTNSTLFAHHLNIMLKKHDPQCCWELSNDGVLTTQQNCLKDMFNYSTTWRYFKLKESNFQQTVGRYQNYGSFFLTYLPFPYKILLNRYPLVLAVGSGHNVLEKCEIKHLSDHFNISLNTMVSPLDSDSAKFDPTKDFSCISSKVHWMVAIMAAINVAIERRDTVLVFFYNKTEMLRFQSEFIAQLKRLNVADYKRASVVKHPEILRDEITILVIQPAERSEGEFDGADCHVIQTFFSEDPKEEDLIRRQAEQKHARGSYEIILCKTDDSLSYYYENSAFISYELLVNMRARLSQSYREMTKKRRFNRFKKDQKGYRKLVEYCKQI